MQDQPQKTALPSGLQSTLQQGESIQINNA